MCKPQKMHGDDSRTRQLQRESIGHEQQLQELAMSIAGVLKKDLRLPERKVTAN
jgi:hypothetical protein